MKLHRFIFSVAFAASLFVSCTSDCGTPKATKNVILMIPDGTSTSVLACARWYKQSIGEPATLAVDEDLCGLVRSFMTDAPISGSAGAMSAYMTGVLAQSPNISIYPQANPGADIYPVDSSRTFQPAMTVMEAAKYELGKSIGLAVTVEYNHATPAACASHSYSRNDSWTLREQMASLGMDVCFGSGANYLSPAIRQILDENGTTLIENDVKAFNEYDGDKPVWAIFGDVNMPYDIDRDPEQIPSLAEETAKAIRHLSKNPKGFFLMVEGSKVDFAGHANDAKALITEFIAFDEAVKVALDFAKKDGNTTVVILPDHGNSAITIGKRDYGNYAERSVADAYSGFNDIKCSISALVDKIRATDPESVADVFKEWTGIDLTKEELDAIKAHMTNSVTDYMKVAGSINAEISQVIESRLNFGFVSGSHTSEDVFLSIYAPKGGRLEGVHTNFELNNYLCQVTGLKRSLAELSDEVFVDAAKVFDGMEMTTSLDGEEPALTVKNGGKTMEIKGNRAYVTVDGARRDLKIPVVFMKKNQTFYVPVELKNF